MRNCHYLNVRQKLLNDCRVIAEFSRHVVELAEEKDEKSLVRTLKGDSRVELLGYLNAMIGHLREVNTVDDLPGDCEEARDLQLYALAALGEYIDRVGDPVWLAYFTVNAAHSFLQGLIDRDPWFANVLKKGCAGELSGFALRALMFFGHFQLTGPEWITSFLKSHIKIGDPPDANVKVGEWMRRQVRCVEALSAQMGVLPSDCVASYWTSHEKECRLAALFPRSLAGYKRPADLRQYFIRKGR